MKRLPSLTTTSMFRLAAALVITAQMLMCNCFADDSPLPMVTNVDLQPLAAQVSRVAQAMDDLGSPLPSTAVAQLRAAATDANASRGVATIQQLLDPLCLFSVQINPEARVRIATGPAPPQLIEDGWREFLVKVRNEAGVTAALHVQSTNAGRLAGSAESELANRWLDLALFNGSLLRSNLSGLGLEYRIMLYSRDAGRREAK